MINVNSISNEARVVLIATARRTAIGAACIIATGYIIGLIITHFGEIVVTYRQVLTFNGHQTWLPSMLVIALASTTAWLYAVIADLPDYSDLQNQLTRIMTDLRWLPILPAAVLIDAAGSIAFLPSLLIEQVLYVISCFALLAMILMNIQHGRC